MRNKDELLAKSCRSMSEAASGALDWFKDNPKSVGPRRAGLERLFKKAAVEARKLRLAAERPMSVGVFGASQSGKSFLIGSLIDRPGHSTKILFGSGDDLRELNFLNDVNPVGGDETTGLVTRFSIASTEIPSPDFPVVLRMLREADLVKILSNTFVLDLRGRPDVEIDVEAVTELFDRLEIKPDASAQPGMVVEDIFELQEYIQEELEDHPLGLGGTVSEAYWQRLEQAVPLLTPSARAQALAPLWGSIAEFTTLFEELKLALDTLGHPELAFAPLDSILDRANGILHVGTIYKLDEEGADDSEEVTLMTGERTTARLRKPVVTALTAELKITLEGKPWPFFEHTDLLDFPGARGRESKTSEEFLRGEDAKPTNRAYCFLRGKIAVLFDKYSADLDLNSMLLCSDDRNQEIRKLADLIHRWVGRTHGVRAADREGKRVALFFCLTKADTLFDQRTGANAKDVVRNRFNKDIEFYKSWIAEWAPGRPFDNLFLVRNPQFQRSDLFSYEPIPPGTPEGYVPPETGLIAEEEERLDAFKATFAGMPIVRTYMADPSGKIDAVLILNDGGITYLADRLAPTCDPDLKYDQILPRALDLSERMRRELSEFHEASDIAERVRERQESAREVGRALQRRPDLIGQLIAFLQADEAMLGEVFMETARGTGNGKGDGEQTSVNPGTASLIIDDDFLGPAVEEPAKADNGASEAPVTAGNGLSGRYGVAAVEKWLERLEDHVANRDLVRTYGIEPEHLSTIVRELSVAARRSNLSDRISASVQPIIQFHQRADEHRPRVAMVTVEIINGLIMRMGRDFEDVELAEPSPLISRPMPEAGELPDLPADSERMLRARGQVPGAWLKALFQLAGENAAASQGGLIDVEQNQRLGELIALTAIQSDGR